ncbi:hypothetical protein GCM10010282_01120 [Streptomyces roseolus]|nr:hypothetical protein GCM10010282_01120 [Streptomyces roseolus]
MTISGPGPRTPSPSRAPDASRAVDPCSAPVREAVGLCIAHTPLVIPAGRELRDGNHGEAEREIVRSPPKNCGQSTPCEYLDHPSEGCPERSAPVTVGDGSRDRRASGSRTGGGGREGREPWPSGRKRLRTCDDPRRGGERGSSFRPTRGGEEPVRVSTVANDP